MSNSSPHQRSQLEKFFQRGLLTLRLLFDQRVDLSYKLIPLLAFLYILSPIDLIPEAALGPLGVFDDIGILLLGMESFIRLAPRHVVQEYSGNKAESAAAARQDDDVIEGEYIVKD
jgi:uncharacterized membrane protein YkvA (DUF1232 family)